MCWLLPATQLWETPYGLLAALTLIALVECFAGFHAWRVLLGINGAIVGFCAGSLLGLASQIPILVPLVAVAGVAGGAILFSMVEPVGMFVFAAASGASFAMIVGYATNIPLAVVIPLAAVAGLTTALVCGAIGRAAILTLTAIAGAQQISSVIAAYLWSLERNGKLLHLVTSRDVAIFLVLAVAGLAVQFLTTEPKARIEV